MNFTEYALKNKALVYFFVFVLVVGGVYSFFTMSKLEDPAITVKQALVITTFPGASAYQVELEVTDVLEKSIRSMGDLDHVSSLSMDDVYGGTEQYGTAGGVTTKLGHFATEGGKCSSSITGRGQCLFGDG